MKKFIILLFVLNVFNTIQAQCTDPSGLNVIGTSETTATFGWTENGTATSWEYEIVLSGATPTGTGIPITGNPYTVSSLVSGENYDVYIRSNCAANGYSNWVGPVAFTTISCIFTFDAIASSDNCLEYCFYPLGSQFGTFFDFNSGVLPAGWNSSPYAVGTPCITNMVDNSPYFWATQTDTNGDRQVTTNTLDVSLGGIVQFYMRYGSDDPDPGCETADLPEEGVRLQYSVNNGANWVDINYWIPTNVLTDDLYFWTQYTENIPVAAQTANTLFRWYQEDNSGTQFDNWGLDNVLVSANTNANFLWDFGDGNTSTLATPCHSYTAEGTFPVVLTVTSPNCNASANATVDVMDEIDPIAICQDFTVNLDATGNATVTANDIDNGSSDNCGIQNLTLSQTTFDCTNVGDNPVILTVTDVYGNTSTCNAIVTVIPSFPEPQNITVTNITTTSAQIDWTPGSTETSWMVEIVLNGNTPTGSGTATSTIPFIATGLLVNTDYQVYIQAISTTGCSELAGPINFSTPCDTFGVPYVEPVETQIIGNAANIDECWSAVSGNYEWRANSGGTGSTGTGPNGAANGVNYFYTEASSPASTGDVAILLSPIFDLTTSTNTFLHFNYHMFGVAMGELHVDLYDGTNWVDDVFVLIGQQHTSNGSAWIQQFIDISSYETVSNFQVRYRGIRGTDFTSDMAIDDITIESITCPSPFNFAISNATGTTVDLSWTEAGSATQWEIEVVPTGNTPTGTGTLVTTNPYTVTNLMANTQYDFYVRAICGQGDESSWVGPITYETPCDTFSVPYVEPVETQITGSAAAIEECWSAVSSDFEWRANSGGTGSTGTGPSGAANGVNYFYTEASSPATTGDVAILLSPIFDLTTSTNTFLHFNYHMFGAAMGELHVDLYDGTNWVDDVFVLIGQQHTSNGDAWIQHFIDISSYETVSNFQVRFRGIRGTDFTSDMAIDDITIESILNCPEPTNFVASNPTLTTIDLNWTEAGSATSWEIEAVPTGTTPTSSGTVVTTNPYTYTGLNSNTTYDFYVRAICSTSNVSSWVGPVTLATLCDDISFDFCPTDIIINTSTNNCFGVPNYTMPTITDVCDSSNTTVTLVQGFAPDGQFPIGITTVEYTASNSVGTTISCQFDVEVLDPFVNLNLESTEMIDNGTITLCNDDTTTLSLTGGDFDGSQTYQWFLDSNPITNQTSNTLTDVNTTGNYSVTVSLGTCDSTFNVDVLNIITIPTFEYEVACEGATATITGTLNGTFDFEVLPSDSAIVDSNTGEITNGTPGETYSINYTTPTGPCQESSIETVTLLPLDDAGFYVDTENLFCFSAKMIVTGSTVGTFSFNPIPTDGATIDPITGDVNNTQPDTYYTVEYTTNEICSNTESVMYLTPENCIIPQGISPNGDEYNEYFEVSWLKATHITIYNRYGREVYTKPNYRNEWNGISNNNDPLPTGTYFYSIEVPEGKPIVGWVYINR